MEAISSLISIFRKTAAEALAATVDYFPSLMAAILVLFAGWLFARLARGAARRILYGANRILDRVFQRGALSGARLSPAAAAVLGEISFWVVIFLAMTIAARVARFTAVSGWLNQIVTYLPNLLVGAAIIVVGYFVSVIIGEQVTSAARAARAGQSALMGKFAQGAVFITALIIGLDQIGVNVTFLVALFAVSVGAIFVGFSIAFGLGAREYVSNLIGARTARRKLRAGLVVRMGDIEGEILEITPTQIELDTARGRTLVPARLADERSVLIVSAETKGDAENG